MMLELPMGLKELLLLLTVLVMGFEDTTLLENALLLLLETVLVKLIEGRLLFVTE